MTQPKGEQQPPTLIPKGHYLSKSQVAAQERVKHRTVQQWIDKGWLKSLYIKDLGHLINVDDLSKLIRPKPGREPKAQPNNQN